MCTPGRNGGSKCLHVSKKEKRTPPKRVASLSLPLSQSLQGQRPTTSQLTCFFGREVLAFGNESFGIRFGRFLVGVPTPSASHLRPFEAAHLEGPVEPGRLCGRPLQGESNPHGTKKKRARFPLGWAYFGSTPKSRQRDTNWMLFKQVV